jgi:PPK2 family polyphosphate:nucleotide phosphotransferase
MLPQHAMRYTASIMKPRKLIKEAARIASRYSITDGKKFRLKDFDPADTNGVKSKKVAQDLLARGGPMLAEMQEKLYAQDVWALLLIFQGMDAAGKDGAIGVNPQGCDVYAFKAPTNEELEHDFLWREHRVVPGRGKIGIFNRSYYEEVLVVRVHPLLLKAEKLPEELITKHIWQERYEDINTFEKFLVRNGVVIRKFFLYISKEEQKKRFLERLQDPKKNWKFSMDDIKERRFWDDYHEAYEEMVQNTSTKRAPWFVIPADNKWYARLVVASAIIEALDGLDLQFPDVDEEKKKELETIREALLAEKD